MRVLRNLQRNSKRNPKDVAPVATPQTAQHVYYFGSFCLNQSEQRLLRNGEPVRLAPKAFEILLVLIENKGSLVTKNQLLREVWPDVFVEEANLSVNIANLRKALDEGNAERQCIETVPKRGYRFVAQVTELTYLNSLAVLPFENEGCGPAGEYLSAGLMESITNTLSQSRELRVMARHMVYSCQQRNIDPRAVGYELGVRSVLLGRILQLGDRLIVRTELVDVMNGWQLWGEQYHTTLADILIIQQELTAKISTALLAIT
jgi:DNA-binding winged helix-turn-helix (wHTH) protein